MVPETVAHMVSITHPLFTVFSRRFTEFPSDTSQQTFLRSLPKKGGKGGQKVRIPRSARQGMEFLPPPFLPPFSSAPASHSRAHSTRKTGAQ